MGIVSETWFPSKVTEPPMPLSQAFNIYVGAPFDLDDACIHPISVNDEDFSWRVLSYRFRDEQKES